MHHLKSAATAALLVAMASLAACKSSSQGSGLAAAGAYCDCQQLLPVGDRPNYPRVTQPYRGTQCGYVPQIASEGGGLAVSVHPAATRIAYDDLAQDVLGAYPRVDVERDLLVGRGGVAVVASAPGATADELVTVTWIEASGRAIVTKERLQAAAKVVLDPPSYLAPLISLAPASCVKR